MGLISWLVIGGIVGWIAGIIMKDNHGILTNIVIGIVGAFIGGALFARGNINNSPLSISSFAVSLIGAIILLGGINLLRHGPRR